MIGWTIFCAFLFWSGPLWGFSKDASSNVPLDHWSYDFIDRFEAKGVLKNVGNGIKPFSRMEMAGALARIVRWGNEGGELSRVERGELGELKREFREELLALGVESGYIAGKNFLSRFVNGENLFFWEQDRSNLYFDLLFRQRGIFNSGDSNRKTEKIYQTTLGFEIRGNLGGTLGFRTRIRDTREQGTRRYFTRDDVFERRLEFVTLRDDFTDFREADAYFVFSFPWFDVEIGKDSAIWGPGFRENLALSDNVPSFDMVRLRAQYGRFKLVSIAGFLRSNDPDSTRSYVVGGFSRNIDKRKYLAAHRIEIAVYPGVDVGFHEVVIYGDRGLEPTYLNPFMLYWVAETYLGDRDNTTMGLDVDVNLIRGVKLYGALFIDDLKKFKLGKGAISNKLALQGGLFWNDPFGLRDTDLRFEYARLEPWVYTHKFPINTFMHFGSILGHQLGPNGDDVFFRAEHRFSKDVSLAVSLQRERQGENVISDDGKVIRNVGGDVEVGIKRSDNVATKRFLDGVVEKRTRLGFEGSYEVIRDLYLFSSYRRTFSDNVKVEDARTDPVDNELILSIRYNYL